MFISFVLYVPRAARVHMTELVMTPDKGHPRKDLDRRPLPPHPHSSLEGEFFFGRAELEEHLDKVAEEAQAAVRVVVLRLKRAANPDAVCLAVLERFIDRMQAAHVSVLICGIRPDFMKIIDSSDLLGRLGRDRVFVFQETGAIWTSTLEAVRFAYQIVGNDVCDTCPRQGEASLNVAPRWLVLHDLKRSSARRAAAGQVQIFRKDSAKLREILSGPNLGAHFRLLLARIERNPTNGSRALRAGFAFTQRSIGQSGMVIVRWPRARSPCACRVSTPRLMSRASWLTA